MTSLSSRAINFAAFFISLALLGVSYYCEYALGMRPCLLCILQRWVIIAMAATLLLASLHNPKHLGVRIYGMLTLLFALGGIIAAGRQIWLQRHWYEDQVCVPGLSYLLQTKPLPEVIKIMLKGSSDCSKIGWKFLHLSMSEWTLIFFILFALLGLWQIERKQ